MSDGIPPLGPPLGSSWAALGASWIVLGFSFHGWRHNSPTPEACATFLVHRLLVCDRDLDTFHRAPTTPPHPNLTRAQFLGPPTRQFPAQHLPALLMIKEPTSPPSGPIATPPL
eukprot:4744799-Pyramimonas_sp.AAC.1